MKKEFKVIISDLDFLKEDMFYAEYGDIMLDIWHYVRCFRLVIVQRGENWEDWIIEELTFTDVTLIEPLIEIFKSKIINWDYPEKWDFNPNSWYNWDHLAHK